MHEIPYRQIRAVFDDQTIRVYQAYSDSIADSALAAGTFVSPPFKVERMTWIKPSFLWMMYRSGWGTKPGQTRVLAIDMTRVGFAWALDHACLSHYEPGTYESQESWEALKAKASVRIQWDPERDVSLRQLEYRAIQIGLSGEAVKLYMTDWIVGIMDISEQCREIHELQKTGKNFEALALLPPEHSYPIPDACKKIIGIH
jgi:hypothetical protein